MEEEQQYENTKEKHTVKNQIFLIRINQIIIYNKNKKRKWLTCDFKGVI